ncbi:MAG: hypothetical protein J6B09_04490 [Clostridia bacterium]|nr:hypothetical protein [Clostridia bacterium]MBQ8717410.1 hypothetical protein [Clostridia bacterium]
MKKNQFFFEHGLHLATVCAVLGLLLFIPASMTPVLGLRIFFGILVAICLAVGVVFLYLSHHAKKERVHFFLYDQEKGSNLPMSALTPELIQEKTDAYLSEYTDSIIGLWQDIPKKLRLRLETDTQFLPLISYRMLLELSFRDASELLSVFEKADIRAVGYVCRAVRDAGDGELADYIFQLKKNIEENRARIPAFFHKNKRLLEERMLRFVECHIGDFYMDQAKK